MLIDSSGYKTITIAPPVMNISQQNCVNKSVFLGVETKLLGKRWRTLRGSFFHSTFLLNGTLLLKNGIFQQKLPCPGRLQSKSFDLPNICRENFDCKRSRYLGWNWVLFAESDYKREFEARVGIKSLGWNCVRIGIQNLL